MSAPTASTRPHSHSVRPLRDAVLAALTVSLVSGLGLAATYYFSRQVQIESEQRELLQLARVAATTIDVAAYRTLDDPSDDGGETYRRVLAPLVALQRAAPEAYYLYTLNPAPNGRGFVHGVDTAKSSSLSARARASALRRAVMSVSVMSSSLSPAAPNATTGSICGAIGNCSRCWRGVTSRSATSRR